MSHNRSTKNSRPTFRHRINKGLVINILYFERVLRQLYRDDWGIIEPDGNDFLIEVHREDPAHLKEQMQILRILRFESEVVRQ
jgi:hypothetical protein